MLVTIAEQVIVDAEQTTRVPAGAEPISGILVPGFVDVHVHGGDGADFMDAARRGHGAHPRAFTRRMGPRRWRPRRSRRRAAICRTRWRPSPASPAKAPAAPRSSASISRVRSSTSRVPGRRTAPRSVLPTSTKLAALIAEAPRLRWMIDRRAGARGRARTHRALPRPRAVLDRPHGGRLRHEPSAALEWGAVTSRTSTTP